MTDNDRRAAEQCARVLIDRQLVATGWVVQNCMVLNLFAGQGVAVRKVVMATGHGRADYLLYVDQRAGQIPTAGYADVDPRNLAGNLVWIRP